MVKKLLTLAFVGSMFSQVVLAEVPTQALTFDTNVSITNATVEMTEKIRKAEDLIKRVIASQTFKDRVLNHTYGGVKTFVDNDGYSNAEIYQQMLDGAEWLNKVKNNTMDLQIEMYYESSSTVGYTYSGSPKIYANTKFYNSYSPATITGNMTHEWLHKLGFSHAVYYSTSRDYSVPYAIGTIMREIAASLPAVVEVIEYINPATQVAFTTSASNITLTWAPASSSNGIESYKIYRKLAGSTTNYLQGTTTGTSFSQTLPSSNATYYVKAVDKAGKTSNSAVVEYVKLTAVSNLALTKTTSNVNLKWSAAAGAKEYKIYLRLVNSSSNYLQGTTTSLSFTQSKPSSSAYYYVRSVDANGATMKSVEVKYTR